MPRRRQSPFGSTSETTNNNTTIIFSPLLLSSVLENCGHGVSHEVMTATMEPALDEIMWSSPGWVQLNNGIHENSGMHGAFPAHHALTHSAVLFYFAESPFFDHTSNNAAIFTQAMYNPDMHQYLASREIFEEQLRTMQGLEYVVHMSARDFGPEAPIQQGVWVIRKQNRRKRAGSPDEITVLGTYYVVGDHIYMAPSVANILQARLVRFKLRCVV
jgi:mediator of RNA polymerase II transcription subunit 6